MTNKVALSKTQIAGLKVPRAGRTYYHDSRVPGLTVCVTAAGSKTWYVYRWAHGGPQRRRLGTTDELSAEQARKLAAVLNSDIAKGEIPRTLTRRGEPTLQQLFDHWLETYGKPRKRTWPDDVRMFDKYLGALSTRKLSAIRRQEVQAMHSRLGRDSGPYQANRVLALLSAIFSRAIDLNYEGGNPCRGVERFRERSRDRFLQPAELPRFFAALEAEAIGDFFKICLFTGARCGNVKQMAWGDIDLANGIWRIPDTKNGEPLLLPLAQPAIEILATRLSLANGCPWVFPGTKGHIKDVKKSWRRIIEAAGLPGLRIHDLRRSSGSWMAGAGVSLTIVGKSLGHKSPDATAVYARLNLDPVRAAVDAAAGAMIAAAQPTKPRRRAK